MRFKLFGVRITLSFFFAAVIAFILCIDKSGLSLPVLTACLFHEAGHLCAMKICGVQPSEIALIPAGIIITAPFFKRTRDDLFITASGPLANFLLSLIFALLFKVFENETLLMYSAVNVAVGGYNLLPVCGLDGGTLMSLLFVKCGASYERAQSLVRIITVFLSAGALMFFVYLLLGGNFNLSLAVFAVYMLVCALILR